MSNKNKKNAAASEHGTYTYYQFPCPNNNGHIGHELDRICIIFPLGDFYKLPFRKFRENIWKIVGGNEGAMRAL